MFVLLLLCALACAGQVSAQSGSASVKEPADYRQTVQDAVSEFEAGHFEESRALFTRAHALLPNARSLRGLGMVEFELRNYPESIRNLEEALASKARRLEGDLRTQTQALLTRARAYVSRVGFVLQPAEARVLVDDAPITLGPERALLLTVGEHMIEVQADGYRGERRVLSLKSGGDQTVPVTLQRLAASEQTLDSEPVATSDTPSDSAPPAREAASTKGKHTGAWILTGGSAAVLAVGIALIAIGFNDIAKVENASPGTSWSSVEAQQARAPVMTGTGFALSATGVVGLVAGLVWALKKPQSEVDRQATTRALMISSGRF
jgi:hypothetical protein